METKEKNFEQDIESWLLNEGGYVYRGDRPHDIKRRLIRSYTTTLMSSLPLVIVRARFDCLSVGSFIVFQGFLVTSSTHREMRGVFCRFLWESFEFSKIFCTFA